MPPRSDPPRFTGAERESLFEALRQVQTEIDSLRRETRDYSSVRESYQRLQQQVLEMLNQDVEQAQAFGKLSATVASLVTTVAAHAGGQVGGMTGAAAGLDSARLEGRQSRALNVFLTLLFSFLTTVVVEAIRTAHTPPVPPAPMVQP